LAQGSVIWKFGWTQTGTRPGFDFMCEELQRKRTWGFRFSAIDAIALIVFGVAIAVLQRFDSSLSWIVAIVAGHFFLFCNIFRLVRQRELIWAVLFVVNVGSWLFLGQLDWFKVLACQLPVSAGVIAWELKAARYHGLFADRINPALPDYLEGRIP
jgi:uncharacterized membrane protein (UPF0136 family)